MNNKGLKITVLILFAAIIGLIIYNVLWADDAAYRKAIETNTIKSYKEFLSRYPNSEYANDIQSRYDEKDYREAVGANTDSAYLKYLKEHPYSVYIDSVMAFVEELEYEKAIKSTNPSICRTFIEDYPHSSHISTIQKKLDNMETDYYKTYINVAIEKLSRTKLQEYNQLYPNGRYASQVSTKLNDLNDYEAFLSAKTSNTKYAWQCYIDNYPKGKYVSRARAKIREIEERESYLNHSLSNGAQPYASKYGYNSSCQYWGCSAIVVNAPYNSDVVTLIKNSSGRVVRHAYIRAGKSYTFEVPNGTYKPYFYYGKGWYPKKEMSKGVKGGFLTDETHSYVHSCYLEDQEWTITLQLTIGGNLSSHPCSESEMF